MKLETIFGYLQTLEKAQLPLLIICIMALWFFKLDLFKLFDFFHQKKVRDLKTLVESLDNHHLSDSLKVAVQEKVETELFFRSYGMFACKPYREALVKFNKKHPLDAEWLDLKRAYSYTDVDKDGNLRFKVKYFDKFYVIAVRILSRILIVMGYLFLTIYTLVAIVLMRGGDEIENGELIDFNVIQMSLFSVILGVFINRMNLNKKSAVKLNELDI
ncbi:TPA: hypothetical protein ACPJ2O_001520 [Vibrio diabolicus]